MSLRASITIATVHDPILDGAAAVTDRGEQEDTIPFVEPAAPISVGAQTMAGASQTGW